MLSTRAVIISLLLVWVCTSEAALIIRGIDGSPSPGCGTMHAGTYKAGSLLKTAARNDDTDSVFVSKNGLWKIHYNLPGTAKLGGSIANLDADGSGYPDFVEATVAALNSARNLFLDQLGYTWIHNDGLAGGGPEYDVYIRHLGQFYGFAWEPDPLGGYMQIDNGFTEDYFATPGLDGMRVTIAHELFHAIQFDYYTGSRSWMETTATFMEEMLHPAINDWVQYLDPAGWTTYFDSPEKTMLSFNSVVPYGASIFLNYMRDMELRGRLTGSLLSIRRTFEEQARLKRGGGETIVGPIEETTGRDFADLLSESWVWNYFSSQRAQSLPGVENIFHHDALLLPAQAEATSEVTALSDLGMFTGTATAQGMAAQLISIVPDGSEGGFRVDVEKSFGDRWAWRIMVRRGNVISEIKMPEGVVEVGRWNEADDILLVGANDWPDATSRSIAYTVTYDANLDSSRLPQAIHLGQNFPNPFNPTTSIPITLNGYSKVRIEVFDMLGRYVRTIADRWMRSGRQYVEWDGTDKHGRPVAAGIYAYRWSYEGGSQTRLMTLLR